MSNKKKSVKIEFELCIHNTEINVYHTLLQLYEFFCE